MRRRMAAGLLGLSLVGCAQSKPLLNKQDPAAPKPVALTPVPSIHDTINRGLGGKAMTATTLPDSANPRWAGQAPPPGTELTPPTAVAAKAPTTAPPVASAVAAVAPANRAAAEAMAPAAPATASMVPPTNLAPADTLAPAAPATASMAAPTNLAPADTLAPAAPATASMAAPASSSLSPASSVATGMAEPAASPARTAAFEPSATPKGDAGDLPVAAGLPPLSPSTTETGTAPASMPRAPLSAASQPDSDPAVSVSNGSGKVEPNRIAPRASDPLLGPSPDLMPALPPLPDPAAKSVTAPAAPTRTKAGPSSPPVSAPTGGALDIQPAPAPPDGSSPGSLPELPPAAPGSASAAPPARLPIADLRLEPAPGVLTPGDSPPVSRKPRRDGRVLLASMPVVSGEETPAKKRHRDAGRPVARVGEEVITFRDLVLATKEKVAQFDRMSPPNALDTRQQMERSKQISMVARRTLDSLIEQTMLAQEAKRRIKDPKQLDRLLEGADKWWREEELPALQRQNHVKTEQELSALLSEQGRSLDALKRSFRQTFLSQTFLRHELQGKVKVELPDLLRYYNEHLKDHQFDRPASITWREIIVEPDKHKSPEEARRIAMALSERVRTGESFADLARRESDGPTSSRRDGGLMRTAPGGYRVAAVNKALETLPIGRPSEVIEGADGFHIVRVEARRAAGPATFEEVQDEIKPRLIAKKEQEEMQSFLSKIRERTTITTLFDSEPNDLNRPAE